MFFKKLSKLSLSEKILYFGFFTSIVILFSQEMTPSVKDTIYHLGKILRISDGEFFADPIIGGKTIYPEIFHVFFALFYKILPLNTMLLPKFIQLFNYIFFLLALTLLCKRFLKNKLVLLFAIATIHLVMSASTKRILFIANPFNLALPLALVGIHYLFEYKNTLRKKHLILLSFFSSLSINIWWFFFYPFGILLLFFSFDKNFRNNFWKTKHLILAIIFAFIPCIYTIIHFTSMWETLLNYKNFDHITPPKNHPLSRILFIWFRITILRGNDTFVYKFLRGILLDREKSLLWYFIFLNVLHFTMTSVPFYVATYFNIFKQRKLLHENKEIFMQLLLPALFIILTTFWVLIPGNVAHLRRIQSISYIFLHICFFYIIEHYFLYLLKKYQVLLSLLCITSLIFGTIYRHRSMTFRLNPSDKKVINFIEKNNFKNEKRVFADQYALFNLLPHTILNSYTIDPRRGGLYFRQDPKLSTFLHDGFFKIINPRKNWKKTLDDHEIRYLIFRNDLINERRIIRTTKFYSYRFKTIFKNDSWLILDITKPKRTHAEKIKNQK